MSDVPAPLGVPRANRLRAPSWLDGRFVLGVLLVLVSVVVGARVLAGADAAERVYVAARDLAPGTEITAADLRPVRVRLFEAGQRYVSAAGPPPLGYLVDRPLAAGEFVPRAALRAGPPSDQRLVSLPVQPNHYPAGLQHGDLVDVYLTPKPRPDLAPVPSRVLSGVPVDGVYDGRTSRLAAAGDVGVVLRVPADAVPRAVAAAQRGSVDLVRVPR